MLRKSRRRGAPCQPQLAPSDSSSAVNLAELTAVPHVPLKSVLPPLRVSRIQLPSFVLSKSDVIVLLNWPCLKSIPPPIPSLYGCFAVVVCLVNPLLCSSPVGPQAKADSGLLNAKRLSAFQRPDVIPYQAYHAHARLPESPLHQPYGCGQVRSHTRTHARTHTHAHTNARTYTCAQTHARTRAHAHKHKHLCQQRLRHTHTHTEAVLFLLWLYLLGSLL